MPHMLRRIKYTEFCLSFSALVCVFFLAGCASNVQLNRDTPVPVSIAPLRQPLEVVPVNGLISVRSGDTLYDIAARYRVTPESIIQANDLFAPFTLRSGQIIKIIPPRVHVVRFGDSINLISKRYAVSSFQIVQLNGLKAPFELIIGQKLQLPLSLDFSILDNGVPKKTSSGVAKQLPSKKKLSRKEFVAPELVEGGFRWPVKGKIIVDFGPSARGVHNDGVNISAEAGSIVTVSASGTVAFVGENIKNFGKLVLVKHEGGIITAYAHLQQITVNEGDVLADGASIGVVGATGRVDSPQLHFEIRKSRQPIDPSSLIS